ncbi:MAG: hypothetical protein KBF28_01000 [Gemmatimonadales bacterium]|nr:hypothetical protein [Gemmatimonadales bacterium]
MKRDEPAILDENAFLGLLRNGEAEPRQAFVKAFGRMLPPIARRLARTHSELDRLNPLTSTDERASTVHMFLHAALNNVFTSTLLLVEGYPLASGNLMRHYAESCAMALLIVDDNASVWNEFDRLGNRYPVHKAVHRLTQEATSRRLETLIGFDSEAWREFVAMSKIYDGFSHSSALSLGFHMMFDQPGTIIFGSQFDPAKRRELGLELKRRSSALPPLEHLVKSVHRVMQAREEWKGEPPRE